MYIYTIFSFFLVGGVVDTPRSSKYERSKEADLNH